MPWAAAAIVAAKAATPSAPTPRRTIPPDHPEPAPRRAAAGRHDDGDDQRGFSTSRKTDDGGRSIWRAVLFRDQMTRDRP